MPLRNCIGIPCGKKDEPWKHGYKQAPESLKHASAHDVFKPDAAHDNADQNAYISQVRHKRYSRTVSRQLRIAVLGGESTGKTTLILGLAAITHGVVVTEVLRDFVQEHHRPPHQEDQRRIMLAQRQREDQAIADHPCAVIFCDPAVIMTAIYSDLYFKDRSLHDQALSYSKDYDATFWCRPDIPWVADIGQHDGPDFRDRADSLIQSWVGQLGTVTSVHEITGQSGRLDLAHELLSEQFGSVWESVVRPEPT